MKAKTRELTGAALDWAVAVCEGATEEWRDDGPFFWRGVPCIRVGGHDVEYSPATDWAQGGPIIERERIHVCPIVYNDLPATECWVDAYHPKGSFYGPTALIAAMRCYVASKMGEEIDIPRSLI
jgi:hypothetical protein